jgi:homoserine O-acetyltransferase/O-succinyltransferase
MKNLFQFNQPFTLESGRQLDGLKITYSDYGSKTAKRVIWVCHAMSGSSEVLEWWPGLFGHGQLFDPADQRIICANIIGSCYGSTGPAELDDPAQFPLITIKDLANAHALLADDLGLQKIDVLIGASLGGQQAIEWSLLQPHRFEKLILIATNAVHSPYARAFNEVQRLAIEADITYGLKNGGEAGLKAARAIAMISYRSYTDFNLKQNETANKMDDYKAASYVRYQGQKFIERFNPYSYYVLTKAMDSHDIQRGRAGSYEEILSHVKSRTLVIGIDSDSLFPLHEQRLLAGAIPNAHLGVIKSPHGHDSFLIDYEKLQNFISEFLFNEFKTYRCTQLKKTYLN